jgi:predicted protein tyrosine phosphatase
MFDNWNGKWETKSAGIKHSATHHIEQEDVDWADIILVMEPYQGEYITNQLNCSPDKVHSLDIKDNYDSHDPAELVELKKELLKKAAPILDMEEGSRQISEKNAKF